MSYWEELTRSVTAPRGQVMFLACEGEQRLRADLGFEPGEKLTLRHLCAHVTLAQAQPLLEAYAATLWAQVEADVP
jgi:hypothetical protein